MTAVAPGKPPEVKRSKPRKRQVLHTNPGSFLPLIVEVAAAHDAEVSERHRRTNERQGRQIVARVKKDRDGVRLQRTTRRFRDDLAEQIVAARVAQASLIRPHPWVKGTPRRPRSAKGGASTFRIPRKQRPDSAPGTHSFTSHSSSSPDARLRASLVASTSSSAQPGPGPPTRRLIDLTPRQLSIVDEPTQMPVGADAYWFFAAHDLSDAAIWEEAREELRLLLQPDDDEDVTIRFRRDLSSFARYPAAAKPEKETEGAMEPPPQESDALGTAPGETQDSSDVPAMPAPDAALLDPRDGHTFALISPSLDSDFSERNKTPITPSFDILAPVTNGEMSLSLTRLPIVLDLPPPAADTTSEDSGESESSVVVRRPEKDSDSGSSSEASVVPSKPRDDDSGSDSGSNAGAAPKRDAEASDASFGMPPKMIQPLPLDLVVREQSSTTSNDTVVQREDAPSSVMSNDTVVKRETTSTADTVNSVEKKAGSIKARKRIYSTGTQRRDTGRGGDEPVGRFASLVARAGSISTDTDAGPASAGALGSMDALGSVPQELHSSKSEDLRARKPNSLSSRRMSGAPVRGKMRHMSYQGPLYSGMQSLAAKIRDAVEEEQEAQEAQKAAAEKEPAGESAEVAAPGPTAAAPAPPPSLAAIPTVHASSSPSVLVTSPKSPRVTEGFGATVVVDSLAPVPPAGPKPTFKSPRPGVNLNPVSSLSTPASPPRRTSAMPLTERSATSPARVGEGDEHHTRRVHTPPPVSPRASPARALAVQPIPSPTSLMPPGAGPGSTSPSPGVVTSPRATPLHVVDVGLGILNASFPSFPTSPTLALAPRGSPKRTSSTVSLGSAGRRSASSIHPRTPKGVLLKKGNPGRQRARVDAGGTPCRVRFDKDTVEMGTGRIVATRDHYSIGILLPRSAQQQLAQMQAAQQDEQAPLPPISLIEPTPPSTPTARDTAPLPSIVPAVTVAKRDSGFDELEHSGSNSNLSRTPKQRIVTDARLVGLREPSDLEESAIEMHGKIVEVAEWICRRLVLRLLVLRMKKRKWWQKTRAPQDKPVAPPPKAVIVTEDTAKRAADLFDYNTLFRQYCTTAMPPCPRCRSTAMVIPVVRLGREEKISPGMERMAREHVVHVICSGSQLAHLSRLVANDLFSRRMTRHGSSVSGNSTPTSPRSPRAQRSPGAMSPRSPGAMSPRSPGTMSPRSPSATSPRQPLSPVKAGSLGNIISASGSGSLSNSGGAGLTSGDAASSSMGALSTAVMPMHAHPPKNTPRPVPLSKQFSFDSMASIAKQGVAAPLPLSKQGSGSLDSVAKSTPPPGSLGETATPRGLTTLSEGSLDSVESGASPRPRRRRPSAPIQVTTSRASPTSPRGRLQSRVYSNPTLIASRVRANLLELPVGAPPSAPQTTPSLAERLRSMGVLSDADMERQEPEGEDESLGTSDPSMSLNTTCSDVGSRIQTPVDGLSRDGSTRDVTLAERSLRVRVQMRIGEPVGSRESEAVGATHFCRTCGRTFKRIQPVPPDGASGGFLAGRKRA